MRKGWWEVDEGTDGVSVFLLPDPKKDFLTVALPFQSGLKG